MRRLYVYGYLHQIQSSRRLERECGRNLELIWLTGRLTPDFKAIADFRIENGPAIGKVCQQFVALCRNINLLDGNLVAIYGRRFKAVNAKAKNDTRAKLRQKLGEIDKAIERSLGALDRADEVFEQTGTLMPDARMDEMGETQVSLSAPDARSMATTPRMPRIVGHNVQTAVEAENHLGVAHELTMQGYDRDALSMMAVAAHDAMASGEIEAIAPLVHAAHTLPGSGQGIL